MIERVESLFGDITHLHEHHVAAPEEGHDVHDGVEMVDEYCWGDHETP